MVKCANDISKCTRGNGCICKKDAEMLKSCGWFQRGNGAWSHIRDSYMHRTIMEALQINSRWPKCQDRAVEIENYMAIHHPNVI